MPGFGEERIRWDVSPIRPVASDVAKEFGFNPPDERRVGICADSSHDQQYFVLGRLTPLKQRRETGGKDEGEQTGLDTAEFRPWVFVSSPVPEMPIRRKSCCDCVLV